MTQHTHHGTFPELTSEETNATNIDHVLKAWPNTSDFQRQLEFILRDKSIGIDFGYYQELPPNVSPDMIEGLPTKMTQSKKMLCFFRNDIKIGDTIIIAQGLTGCRYLADIASSYYYQSSETLSPSVDGSCVHRRRICNIRKLPDGFCRRAQIKTLAPYKPL